MPVTNRNPHQLPRLVRLYLRQVGIGFGLSAVFVGTLLYLDLAGLRSLMMSTQGGFIAGFLLFFFNGLVFAGVQFGITIMRMGAPETPPSGGKRARVNGLDLSQPAPIRVSADD